MILGLRGQRAVSVLHFLCCLWAIFALVQNIGLPYSARREREHTYGGHWKHLTFLNQVLQTVLFVLCVIIDFVALCIPSQEKKVSAVLVPIRDFIFSTFVFPVGLFVAVVFWGLYVYDRELVYPRELDDINPTWLNHSMHTTILPLLFIELLVSPHKYVHNAKGIFGLTIFTVTYLCWITWIHHVSGIWAYPVLEVLKLPGKLVFFSVAYLIVLTFYFLGRQLTKRLWVRRLRWSPESVEEAEDQQGPPERSGTAVEAGGYSGHWGSVAEAGGYGGDWGSVVVAGRPAGSKLGRKTAKSKAREH